MFSVFLRAPCSEPARESTIFALLVPFLDPRVGAERLVDSEMKKAKENRHLEL